MLEDCKTQVILTAQKAQREGLCRHKSGNVSVFDPESGFFLITPSGIDRELLTLQDICVMDLQMKQIEGGRPSSESLMHAACYRARKDIRAIVHTHSKMATAFAVLNRPVPATVFEMFVFHTEHACIPVAPYARPATEELAQNVAAVIAKNDMALMERHGAIAVGKSAEEALMTAHYIEEFAEIYYYALQINGGKEPPVFTAEELEAWRYPTLPEQEDGIKSPAQT